MKSQQNKLNNFIFGKGPKASPLKSLYQAGHLIGTRLGGPGEWENLVPMTAIFNGAAGDWYKFEEWLAECLGSRVGRIGRKGIMTVDVTYDNNAKTPRRFIPIAFTVNVSFYNNVSGEYLSHRRWLFTAHALIGSLEKTCP